MRIAEALRGLLAATNDKAYRTGEDQDRVTEARAALADWDDLVAAQGPQEGPENAPDAQGATQLGGEPERPATGSVARSMGCSEMEQVPVADQRAAFVDAMQWGRE